VALADKHIPALEVGAAYGEAEPGERRPAARGGRRGRRLAAGPPRRNRHRRMPTFPRWCSSGKDRI